jgi:hypothetical protein
MGERATSSIVGLIESANSAGWIANHGEPAFAYWPDLTNDFASALSAKSQALFQICDRYVDQPLLRQSNVVASSMTDTGHWSLITGRLHAEIAVTIHIKRHNLPARHLLVEPSKVLSVFDREIKPANYASFCV